MLVDDAYNASPASVSAAMDLLADMTPLRNGRRIVVLADMLELGSEGPELHSQLVGPIVRAGVDRVHVAGTLVEHLWNALPKHLRGKKVQSAIALIPVLKAELADADVILFKGSKANELSAVVESLLDLGQRSVEQE